MAFLALALLIAGAASGLVVGTMRGLEPTRLARDLLGVGFAATLFAMPGVYMTLMGTVVASTGGGAEAISTGGIAAVAGLAVGALGALALLERKAARRGRGLAFAAGGLGVGLGLGYVAAVLGQQSSVELATLFLTPPAVVGLTVAGFATAQPRR